MAVAMRRKNPKLTVGGNLEAARWSAGPAVLGFGKDRINANLSLENRSPLRAL
jgi:hypothetical protein